MTTKTQIDSQVDSQHNIFRICPECAIRARRKHNYASASINKPINIIESELERKWNANQTIRRDVLAYFRLCARIENSCWQIASAYDNRRKWLLSIAARLPGTSLSNEHMKKLWVLRNLNENSNGGGATPEYQAGITNTALGVVFEQNFGFIEMNIPHEKKLRWRRWEWCGKSGLKLFIIQPAAVRYQSDKMILVVSANSRPIIGEREKYERGIMTAVCAESEISKNDPGKYIFHLWHNKSFSCVSTPLWVIFFETVVSALLFNTFWPGWKQNWKHPIH